MDARLVSRGRGERHQRSISEPRVARESSHNAPQRRSTALYDPFRVPSFRVQIGGPDSHPGCAARPWAVKLNAVGVRAPDMRMRLKNVERDDGIARSWMSPFIRVPRHPSAPSCERPVMRAPRHVCAPSCERPVM